MKIKYRCKQKLNKKNNNNYELNNKIKRNEIRNGLNERRIYS